MSLSGSDAPSWELTFFCKDLGKDATLMLTFQPLLGVKLQQQQVCWKVTTFAAQGPYKITVVFRDQLVYIKTILDGPDHISGITHQPVNVGQQTTLLEYNKVFSFTPAIPMPGSKEVQALNGTQEKQSIALGFIKNNAFLPDFLLHFPEIEPTQTLGLTFSPVLRLYITDHLKYKDSDIITGDVQGDSVWVQDIRNLTISTKWQLFYEENTGQITVQRYYGN